MLYVSQGPGFWLGDVVGRNLRNVVQWLGRSISLVPSFQELLLRVSASGMLASFLFQFVETAAAGRILFTACVVPCSFIFFAQYNSYDEELICLELLVAVLVYTSL